MGELARSSNKSFLLRENASNKNPAKFGGILNFFFFKRRCRSACLKRALVFAGAGVLAVAIVAKHIGGASASVKAAPRAVGLDEAVGPGLPG